VHAEAGRGIVRSHRRGGAAHIQQCLPQLALSDSVEPLQLNEKCRRL
jgi:hypothetical protein